MILSGQTLDADHESVFRFFWSLMCQLILGFWDIFWNKRILLGIYEREGALDSRFNKGGNHESVFRFFRSLMCQVVRVFWISYLRPAFSLKWRNSILQLKNALSGRFFQFKKIQTGVDNWIKIDFRMYQCIQQ